MSSDRWRQVEDLCHAALACRAEERRPFLVKACEGDEALLREVESLIAQESSAEAFMSVPAAAVGGIGRTRSTASRTRWRALRIVHDSLLARRWWDGRGLPRA